MKTRVVWGLLVAAAIPFLSSCSKSSDPKPDLIVGTWTRDYYSLSGAPSTFASLNGFYIPNGSVSYGLFYEDSYTLTLNNDKTYGITLAYPGPDSTDTGKWTKDTKTLTLTSGNSAIAPNEFTIEQDVTSSQLVFSQTETFNLLPDLVIKNSNDTATSWSTQHPEAYDKYYQNVDLKVTYHFKK